MKVRWTTGSIRFRIKPAELDDLLAGRAVRAELAVPGGWWEAAIVPGQVSTGIEMRGSTIYVALSDADRSRLAAPDAEGVYFDTQSEPALHYYIEKDFPCVHDRSVDARECEDETFDAPPHFAQRHKRTKPA